MMDIVCKILGNKNNKYINIVNKIYEDNILDDEDTKKSNLTKEKKTLNDTHII